jgi:hypothetical protein
MCRALFAVCAVLVLSVGAAGCGQDGAYDLVWTFGPPEPVTAPPPQDADGGVGGDAGAAPADAGAGADADLPDADMADADLPDADVADANVADADVADADADVADANPVADASPPDGDTADGGVPEPGEADAGLPDAGASAAACGAHGVFAIHITGASDKGDGEDVIVPCSAGHYTRRVPTGTWHFAAQPLGATNKLNQGGDQQVKDLDPAGVGIANGQTVRLGVVLTPRNACNDGVDNDHDGRVDLADPDCKSADGLAE